jgi:hypothetical protein
MLKPVLSLTSAAVLLAGCFGSPDLKLSNREIVDQAVDAVDLADTEARLVIATLDGAEAATAEQAANNVVANAAARFTPAGCVASRVDGATVSLTFDRCDGPRQLLAVGGALTMALSVNVTTIDAQVTSKGLTVGGQALSVDSTAVYRLAAGDAKKSLTVSTQSSGSGALSGNELDVDGHYDVTWTDTCRTLGGDWATNVAFGDTALRADTLVDGVTRCGDACPGGGSIEYQTGLDDHAGGFFTIAFGGDATASFSLPDGPRGSVPLGCAAAR